MKIIVGHDDVVNAWISKRYGVTCLQSPSALLGVIDGNGVLRGAFVTTWRNDTTAELHIFGRTSNETWKAYFKWVFGMVHRLEISTEKRNKSIKRAAPKFGFCFEGVGKDYYGPGRDALRFYMTEDRCRWVQYRVCHKDPSSQPRLREELHTYSN